MKTIIGAALGNCVHVSGLEHFLSLAEEEGYQTLSLGPAVTVKKLVEVVKKRRPSMVAVSYRLTPGTAEALFHELNDEISSGGLNKIPVIFGGTPPVARVARETAIFAAVFDGTESIDILKAFLRGDKGDVREVKHADTLVDRISQRYPYPLLRHHFGRPTMGETIDGAARIAEAGLLDILSIGPDQNAQEHFFNPDQMDHAQDGAGGVPIRSAEDLAAIYRSTRCGNYPLVRCYSGTRDLIRWAEMSVDTINNAWAAVPLCWYSVMDGRSSRTLEEAMTEHQQVMRWYAVRGIPVEVNESHQWSLRDAHDSLAVAMAFLAAYNARKMGVSNYISQYMFNTPPATRPAMDIAKMLAKNEMIESLSDDSFRVFRQVRAGLAHFSSSPSFAQGQLAASAVVSLSLKPHILHVVGFSEGDHAILPDELIHSCNIVHGVLHDVLYGMPDLTSSAEVVNRKNELIDEAGRLLNAIREIGVSHSDDPWSDPFTISRAIKTGLLDTPHFHGNTHLCGKIKTKVIEGACYAVDNETGNILNEADRIIRLDKAS